MKKFFQKNFGSKRAIVHSSAAIVAAGSLIFFICAIISDAVPSTTAWIISSNVAMVYGLPGIVFAISWPLYLVTD